MILKLFSLLTQNFAGEEMVIHGATTDELLQCLPDIVLNIGKHMGESAALGTQARIAEIWPASEVWFDSDHVIFDISLNWQFHTTKLVSNSHLKNVIPLELDSRSIQWDFGMTLWLNDRPGVSTQSTLNMWSWPRTRPLNVYLMVCISWKRIESCITWTLGHTIITSLQNLNWRSLLRFLRVWENTQNILQTFRCYHCEKWRGETNFLLQARSSSSCLPSGTPPSMFNLTKSNGHPPSQSVAHTGF